jgi:hypothetical protein
MSEETKANITLNDFIVMVKLIDVCSKRGAFEGAELKDVGMLRGRLADFIESNKPKEEESQEQLDLSEKEETAEV